MNGRASRVTAVAAAILGTLCSVGARAGATVPSDINGWFASLTPAQVLPFVQNLPSWAQQGSEGPATISFGAAAPTLGYSLPSFDLSTGTVTGSVELGKALPPTRGYCARLRVSQVPSAIVMCADPTSDGTGYQLDAASEVRFLSGSADLPAGGTTAPDHHFVGVIDGAVVPLDQAARSWMGASRLDGPVFITLAAQQKAEWAAVDKINGPAMGGDIPLIGGDRAVVAAFEEQVSQGSGVPVSRLSHRWTAPLARPADGGSSAVAGWAVPVVSLVGLMAVALVAGVGRSRTRRVRP